MNPFDLGAEGWFRFSARLIKPTTAALFFARMIDYSAHPGIPRFLSLFISECYKIRRLKAIQRAAACIKIKSSLFPMYQRNDQYSVYIVSFNQIQRQSFIRPHSRPCEHRHSTKQFQPRHPRSRACKSRSTSSIHAINARARVPSLYLPKQRRATHIMEEGRHTHTYKSIESPYSS